MTNVYGRTLQDRIQLPSGMEFSIKLTYNWTDRDSCRLNLNGHEVEFEDGDVEVIAKTILMLARAAHDLDSDA